MNRKDSKKNKPRPTLTGNRREFLRNGVIATSVLALSPHILLSGNSTITACDPTTVDLYGLGPFHANNAPFRTVLAAANEPGTRLFITGTVFANDCTTPLEGVEIDIWGADDSGCYSRFEDCDNVSGDDFKLRGKVTTNENGAFSFETVRPGHYLNGAQFRPSHIHLIISPPGEDELVTQLYFEGDQYIPSDLAASDPGAAGRIIPLVEGGSGLSGVFDIVMDVEPQTSAVPYVPTGPGSRQLRQNYPNPVRTATVVPYTITEPGTARLVIYNNLGQKVRTLINTTQPVGLHTIEWDRTDDSGKRVPAGVYHYKLKTKTCNEVRTLVVE